MRGTERCREPKPSWEGHTAQESVDPAQTLQSYGQGRIVPGKTVAAGIASSGEVQLHGSPDITDGID
eukprot:910003-Pelagomonas_calceolata.AAC.1